MKKKIMIIEDEAIVGERITGGFYADNTGD